MQTPLQVAFHNMDRSDAVETAIREKTDKLERHFDRITTCRVVVEAPHRRRGKGKLYAVRIDLEVPGKTLIVNHTGTKNPAHEDVYVALRDAFDAITRQLEDYTRKLRGDVKTHEVPPHGRVRRLFPEQDYGFIELPDGGEIYFHRNAVVDDRFGQLEVGSEVRFVLAPDPGPQGPQASTVTPLGKHHIVGRNPILE